ncbi:uncharacterized protein LOC130732283 [Lotus japonicus]|uniref:uncharacterized protein LOC130732283 n=1 Tax=Lotus japonicus TaxID=34305 RepID=UPI00258FADF1|nr:uncharacterized protein LOC130732283 [Lotus japonicus]
MNDDDGNWMLRKWLPPPEGSISFCVDGSFNHTGRFMGSGGLVRDHQGQWVCGFHSYLAGGSVLQSEARALKLSLQLVWDRGFREVYCSVDCSELIRALEDEDNHRFFPILSDIRELISRQWKVSISDISQDCNQPADWLARRGAFTSSRALCILDTPPSDLEILVLRDRLTLP